MGEGSRHTGAVLVCQCVAVNDRRIVEEIETGALDLEDVAARCGAGTRCGGCHPTIEALLLTVRAAEQPAV
jgi:bacterioferritin-associated ferredoxin